MKNGKRRKNYKWNKEDGGEETYETEDRKRRELPERVGRKRK
jgi:hypothetical protein